MAEQPTYVIRNIVGDSRTRLHRAVAASKQRGKLFIAGRWCLPTKSMEFTKAQFAASADQLKQLLLAGSITLLTPDKMTVTTTHMGEFVLMRGDGASKVLPMGELPSCFQPTVKAVPKAPEPVKVKEPEPVKEETIVPDPPSEPVVEVVEEKDETSKKKKKR